MVRIFQRKSGSVKIPQRSRASQNDEHTGREQKGIAQCPVCGNVQFKKKWHASLKDLQKRSENKKIVVARMKICPACTMVKNRLFEGEIMVKGVPKQYVKDLLGLLRNYGKEATERDPQDRIIAVEKTNSRYRITTTENQLANRIAKKIKEVFSTVGVHFSHSKEPYEVTRTEVIFL